MTSFTKRLAKGMLLTAGLATTIASAAQADSRADSIIRSTTGSYKSSDSGYKSDYGRRDYGSRGDYGYKTGDRGYKSDYGYRGDYGYKTGDSGYKSDYGYRGDHGYKTGDRGYKSDYGYRGDYSYKTGDRGYKSDYGYRGDHSYKTGDYGTYGSPRKYGSYGSYGHYGSYGSYGHYGSYKPYGDTYYSYSSPSTPYGGYYGTHSYGPMVYDMWGRYVGRDLDYYGDKPVYGHKYGYRGPEAYGYGAWSEVERSQFKLGRLLGEIHHVKDQCPRQTINQATADEGAAGASMSLESPPASFLAGYKRGMEIGWKTLSEQGKDQFCQLSWKQFGKKGEVWAGLLIRPTDK